MIVSATESCRLSVNPQAGKRAAALVRARSSTFAPFSLLIYEKVAWASKIIGKTANSWSEEFVEWRGRIEVTVWVLKSFSKNRIVKEHGCFIRTQQHERRVLLSLWSCSGTISVAVESCI